MGVHRFNVTFSEGAWHDLQMLAERKGLTISQVIRDAIALDRVDGIVEERTDQILEHGVRNCERCGKPHNLAATTRRGRRWGQTWAAPDCGTYHPESWESVARRSLVEPMAA